MDGITDITTNPDQTVDVGQRALELLATVVNDPGDIVNAYGVNIGTYFKKV